MSDFWDSGSPKKTRSPPGVTCPPREAATEGISSRGSVLRQLCNRLRIYITLPRPNVVVEHMPIGEVALRLENVWGVDRR